MVVVVLLLRRGPKKTKKKGNRAIKPHSPPHSTIKPLIEQLLHISNIEGRIWCSSIHAIAHNHIERLHSSGNLHERKKIFMSLSHFLQLITPSIAGLCLIGSLHFILLHLLQFQFQVS